MDTLLAVAESRRHVPNTGDVESPCVIPTLPEPPDVRPVFPKPARRGHAEHFDYMLTRLRSWIAQHGSNSHPSLKGEDKDLREWMNTQRSLYKRNKLRQDRIDQLRATGFAFTASGFHLQREDGYQTAVRMIADLKLYFLQRGTMDVPVRNREYPGLGRWCTEIRQVAKKNPNDARVLLVKETCPEFQWQIATQFNDVKTREAVWWANHDAVASFLRKNKQLPRHTHNGQRTEEEIRLGVWLMHQRAAYQGKGAVRLSDGQRKAIATLLADVYDWAYIAKLAHFVASHDRLPCSTSKQRDEKQLAAWLDICESEGGAHLTPQQRGALRKLLRQYGIESI